MSVDDRDQHITNLEDHSDALRSALETLVNNADVLRDDIERARAAVQRCHRATARLRRGGEEPEMMGSLNSLAAAHGRHLSLDGALVGLEAALSSAEDHLRHYRILQPTVITALREGQAASRRAIEAAPASDGDSLGTPTRQGESIGG